MQRDVFPVTALMLHYRQRGVHLPKLGLWLDPEERQCGPERVFISHAHADHIGRHREVILTAPTARLMQARLGGRRIEHVLRFGETREFTGGEISFRITLLPAGHILGSAMAFIEADGQTLLYTGDFKLRPSLSAEPCEPRHADILVMESTFGRPRYQFPSAESVRRDIVDFCRETLAAGQTPVLLAYSLGKSQELLCGLAGAELSVMLHDSVYQLTRIYEDFGQQFPPYERLEAARACGFVLICPPGSNRAAKRHDLGPTRTAVVTGWAVESSCRYRLQVDAAFPLSDHADFPDLVEMVRRVAPGKVCTLHGHAAEFAQTVREMGFAAHSLSEAEQFMLPLEHAVPEKNCASA